MYLILIVLALFALPSGPLYAQDLTITPAWEQLDEIKKSKPAQNAKYIDAQTILSGRILDRTNRVIGDVEDALVDQNGAIKKLTIDFNRLRLGTGSLSVDYKEIRAHAATNGFKIGYSDDEIRARLPQILAQMETAAGSDSGDHDFHSLEGFAGKPLYNEKGEIIGVIENVFFDRQSRRAKFFSLSFRHKSALGKSAVIPLRKTKYQDSQIIVENDYSEILLAFAQEK